VLQLLLRYGTAGMLVARQDRAAEKALDGAWQPLFRVLLFGVSEPGGISGARHHSCSGRGSAGSRRRTTAAGALLLLVLLASSGPVCNITAAQLVQEVVGICAAAAEWSISCRIETSPRLPHLLPFTGISRDSLHKRRATGGRQKAWRKKKK
jgi:hypothetical protein